MEKIVFKETVEATIDLLKQLLEEVAGEDAATEAPAKKTAKAAPKATEKAAPKAAAKGKAKKAEPEPEPEADEESGELTLEDLQEMELPELKKLAAEQELEMPKKVTKATLLKAFEEQFFSDDEGEEAPAEEPAPAPKAAKGKAKKAEPEPEADEESDEESDEEGGELTAEDINEMTLAELKELVTDNEIEVPAATLKNVKKLRAAVIEFMESADDSDGEDFEASPERLEAEDEIEAQIRQQIKTKKLKTPAMKKAMAEYAEGNPDCEDCSNCSTEELTACYIQMKQSFVDDEGEVHEESEPYVRNGVDFCCGAPLQEDNSCAICGEEYDVQED